MKKFPVVENDHVVLLISDYYTGHVLDIKLNLAINDDQDVYSVFKTLGEARKYAFKLIKQNPKIECTIYDSNKTVLKFVNIDNLAPELE